MPGELAEPTGGAPVPAPADTALAGLMSRVRTVTPARIFTGRAGMTGYLTATQLALRADHAAARDAVDERMDLTAPPLAGLAGSHGLFAVDSAAADRREYLRRPDLGRRLAAAARAELAAACPPGADVQLVVGDGLSARAVATQVPGLLPMLAAGAAARGWTVGRPFAIRLCRVGIMNDVGEVLAPKAVILLIGERPGLATAESLSAYLAWCPGPGATDADRNLVANIHARGVDHTQATRRILDLIAAMRAAGTSGVTIKEPDAPALGPVP
jgi:ethanolamine ammonia-lyase small subunit